MSLRRIAVLLAASAAFAVSGCGGDSAGAPGSGSSSAPTVPPAAPSTWSSTAPSASPTTAPTSGRPTATGGQTLSGTVEAGVEPGCLLLRSAGRQHVLIFDDPALKSQATVGASITVSGTAEPGQMTTCQQGVPFIVTGLRAN